MGLNALQQAVETAGQMGDALSGADREYVVQFAFQTGDTELTNKLLDELSQPDADREAVYRRFNALTDFKPDWIRSIENLLVSIEMYRIQEEKAVQTLTEILSAFGMEFSVQEIKALTPEQLKDYADRLKMKGTERSVPCQAGSHHADGPEIVREKGLHTAEMKEGECYGGRNTGSSADHTRGL